jgi:ribosome-associated translation inhibitor RaiA
VKLGTLAAWLKQHADAGVSLHIRSTGGNFVVVAHSAGHTVASDCTDADLERAIELVVDELSGKLTPPQEPFELGGKKPLRKRSEIGRTKSRTS